MRAASPSFSHVFTYYLSTCQFLRDIQISIHNIYIYIYIFQHHFHRSYIYIYRVLFQTLAVNVNHFSAIQTPEMSEVQTHPLRGLTPEAADVSWQLQEKSPWKQKPSGTPTLNHHFCQLNHMDGPNLKPTLTLNHLNGPQLLMVFISTVFWSEDPMMIFCAPNWDEAW